ncbi:MAG TPA: hotdog fold domain-containing protein [Gemmatimonadales bacterium]|nr:hotdog fold domain-containing protein [Gemmatimonadales bacterium]
MDTPLNQALLRHNTCFGCGLDNPSGLQLRVTRDPTRPGVLCATLTPPEGLAGFPGITHGGILFTALDCLSTWVATVLGPNRQAGWILRSATTTYHQPAPVGHALRLEGSIKESAGPWDAILVQTEARRADGSICVEAQFKVLPLPPARLAGLAGLAELPDNWRDFLAGGI